MELVIYKLIAGEYPLAKFEEWIYSSSELEAILNPEEYLAIISLDYSQPSSLYEAEKVLRNYIDTGEYYEWYISRVLQAIIDRPPDVYKYIEQCYELYCKGFSFLEKLALDYGLKIRVLPSNYSVQSWCELSLLEQNKLLDDFYPDVAEEAKQVLNWFGDRRIIIIDRNKENKSVNFFDRRSDSEKY